MTLDQFPDSQKEPLGPKQIAWIDAKYGKAFFRESKPMVEHDHCNLEVENDKH